MPIFLTLFTDVDVVDDLIEQTMPYFALWIAALALILVGFVAFDLVQRFRPRSPVEKLLRRRFG